VVQVTHVLAHVPVPFEEWRDLPEAQRGLTPIVDCAQQVGAAAQECLAMAPRPESIAPTETIAYVLGALALILIVARLVGWVFVKIGQPRVVGEIIAGILIGPTVLGGHLGRGDVTETPGSEAIVGHGLTNDLYPLQSFAFINLLGQITLVFFMFLVGMEVQQRFLKGRGKQIAVVAVAVVAVPVGLGFIVAAILNSSDWKPAAISQGTHALILGAGLAVTAFPVMARVLQEKRMIATAMGATGVGAAAVVTPLMFLVLAAAAASQTQGSGAVDDVAIKALLAIALVALLFLVVRPFMKRVLLKDFDPDKPISGDLFAFLVVGALLSGLAADRIGINALNGGFLFGACVPQIAGIAKAVLDRMADFVIIFLIPIFLAVAGIQTDFRVLTFALIPGILLFLFAMIAGKWFVGTGAGMAVGLKWRDANVIGILMNCRGLMILAAAIVAGSFGGITPEMRVTFALGAIVTTMMTGPLVDLFVKKEEQEEERDKSIAGSLGDIPAMTGGPRVVVVPGDARNVLAAANAAERFAGGDGPPAQFLVTTLAGTRRHGDYVGAIVEDEGLEVEATRGWLEAAAQRLQNAEVVTFQTPDPEADLVKLATDWAATDAVVVSERDAKALEAAGITVHRAEPTPRSPSGVLLVDQLRA
jgi:Kef-type K+ transport system membrane component KefB